jgi:nucleoside-triphosphatase THEP1
MNGMPGQLDADRVPVHAPTGSGSRIGLLTGPVGVGKTTVAERVVGLARRKGLLCGGLLAPAMVTSCGQKVGIWGVDVETGERRILARSDRNLGGPSVGPYSFDANALAWAATVIDQALETATPRPNDLVVVDEIGKLELWYGIGLAPVLPKLAAAVGGRWLVLVRDSLLAELQARLAPAEQVVFAVDEENRGVLAPRILTSLM